MSVELLTWFGDDNMVCDVARVSHNKQAKDYSENKNAGLIKYLAEHKHTSPFRHPHIQFRIKCPIYVERQLFTHVIGIARNSISGRYVDFSDTYTNITEYAWRGNPDNIKQGSGQNLDISIGQEACKINNDIIVTCKQAYENLIKLGVCKEQARTILPLCLNTQFIWTLSLQAFWHLCELRLKPTAQRETMEVVAEMLKLVKELPEQPFKYSLIAFGL